METKENTEMTAKAVSKALAERATSQMKHFKRVYGDITPEKGAMTSKIVMDALENLSQAISYPSFRSDPLPEFQVGASASPSA